MQTIKLLIQELRPKQWLKNIVIFLPAIFVNDFFNLDAFVKILIGFFLFSLTAGGLYIINDIVDREKDLAHPEKKNRPIASGRFSIVFALIAAAILLFGSLSVTWRLFNQLTFGILFSYILLVLVYSYYFKHIPVLDMIIVAIGFVLRVAIGAAIIGVAASSWILVTTFFFALFLIACKRRLELKLLETKAVLHRAVLDHYAPDFSNIILGITATLSLGSFSIYTLEESVVARLGTENLIYSVPFVFIFISRMIYLVTEKKEIQTSDPTNLILKDKTVFWSSVFWIIVVLVIIRG